MSFLAELKRRNVVKVAVLYIVASWLLLQVTDVLASLLPVPDWLGALVFSLLVLGFFQLRIQIFQTGYRFDSFRRSPRLDSCSPP